MSYPGFGVFPSGVQVLLRIPLALLGVVGLVLALTAARRLGGRAATLAVLGSVAFILDAILNIISIVWAINIYTSDSADAFLDSITLLDALLTTAGVALLSAAFYVRRPGDAGRPAPGAPQLVGYGGYPGAVHQPPAQPQYPYPPPGWPHQGPAPVPPQAMPPEPPASPLPPAYPQPPAHAQPPAYPQPPTFLQPPALSQPPAFSQPPAHPQPPAYPQPPQPEPPAGSGPSTEPAKD
jgi:hypothetical protein